MKDAYVKLMVQQHTAADAAFLEKLEKVLKQEEEKILFLETNFKEGVLRKS